MNYKISRTEKLHDTLEFTDESGKIVKTIDVTVDIGIISKDMMQKYESFRGLHAQLRALRKTGTQKDFQKLAGVYVAAVDELFSMCFGDKTRLEIYEFFENDFNEMVQQVVPYIVNRILPETKRSVERQKKALKRAFK